MNTITLSDEQMKALQSGQSITIEPTITKWEPKGGVYAVCYDYSLGYHMVTKDSNSGITRSGLTYTTQDQAQQAAKALRLYARQLSWLSENYDGWTADWDNDRKQHKWYVSHNANKDAYEAFSTCTFNNMGRIHMSKPNAQKLAQLLNDGIVEF